MLTYLRKRLIRRECCDRLGLGRDCKMKDIRYCKSHECEAKIAYIYHENIKKKISFTVPKPMGEKLLEKSYSKGISNDRLKTRILSTIKK